MKLICPRSSEHQTFVRESYDSKGNKVNVELVDQYGRFIGDRLDLYTGDVTYRYFCADCQAEAEERDRFGPYPRVSGCYRQDPGPWQ